MGYRDDLEALRRRNAALERELAAAQEQISQLKGEPPSALAAGASGGALVNWKADGRATRWLGAPVRLSWSREYVGTPLESVYAEITERARQAIGTPGTITKLEGIFSWHAFGPQGGVAPVVTIEVSARRGKTHLRVDERFGNWAGAIFGGVGGGVGGGFIMLPVSVAWVAPMLTPLAVLGWLGLVYGVCRKIYQRRVRTRAQKLQLLARALDKVLCENLKIENPEEKGR